VRYGKWLIDYSLLSSCACIYWVDPTPRPIRYSHFLNSHRLTHVSYATTISDISYIPRYHSRRVAAPPSDESERRRARLKVETIELRLSALRAEEEMCNPKDHTRELVDQLDLMNVGKPVKVELKVKSMLLTRPYVSCPPVFTDTTLN
jgi:hypothetical protein